MPVPVPPTAMKRRAFLRRACGGAGLAGLAGLAGCFGGGGNTITPSQTYYHRTFTPSPTPAGIVNTSLRTSTPSATEFVVTYGVRNNAESEATATVTLTVTFDAPGTPTPDTVTRKRSKTVTLDGQATDTLEFTFQRPEGATLTNLESSIEQAD